MSSALRSSYSPIKATSQARGDSRTFSPTSKLRMTSILAGSARKPSRAALRSAAAASGLNLKKTTCFIMTYLSKLTSPNLTLQTYLSKLTSPRLISRNYLSNTASLKCRLAQRCPNLGLQLSRLPSLGKLSPLAADLSTGAACPSMRTARVIEHRPASVAGLALTRLIRMDGEFAVRPAPPAGGLTPRVSLLLFL